VIQGNWEIAVGDQQIIAAKMEAAIQKATCLTVAKHLAIASCQDGATVTGMGV